METKMSHKIEVGAMITGAFASTFVNDLMQKIIITTVAMVIGTTVAYYWKILLEKHRNKKK
jgi:hypothetical protein